MAGKMPMYDVNSYLITYMYCYVCLKKQVANHVIQVKSKIVIVLVCPVRNPCHRLSGC